MSWIEVFDGGLTLRRRIRWPESARREIRRRRHQAKRRKGYFSIGASWGYKKVGAYQLMCRHCQFTSIVWEDERYYLHPSGWWQLYEPWWQLYEPWCECIWTDRLGNLLDYGEPIVATCRLLSPPPVRVACVMGFIHVLVIIDGFAVRSLDLCCSEVVSTRAFALLRTRLRFFLHKVTKCAEWREKTQNQVCLLAFLLNAVNASAIYSLRCCSRSLQKWCEDASSVDDLIWVHALLETEG